MQSVLAPAPAHFFSGELHVHTTSARQFIDITDDITALTRESGLSQGLVLINSQHTTAAILVNEHEPELLRDLQRLLSEIAPESAHYHHNAVPCLPGERENGHAHCQALLLNSSATVPLAQGSLVLGRYQRVFLVELDHARPRRVTVTLLGS